MIDSVSPGSQPYGQPARKFSNLQDDAVKAQTDEVVRATNLKTEAESGRKLKQSMGKDDFLSLLVTQLKNQDPSAPLEDKQFIAQMAQFSSLEQMNNLTKQFESLSGRMAAGQAFGMLGRTVDVSVGSQVVSGRVDEVTNGAFPQVLVNGTYYDYTAVARVKKD